MAQTTPYNQETSLTTSSSRISQSSLSFSHVHWHCKEVFCFALFCFCMTFDKVFPCSGVIVSIKEKVESTLLECFYPGEVEPAYRGGAHTQTRIGPIRSRLWLANFFRAMFFFFLNHFNLMSRNGSIQFPHQLLGNVSVVHSLQMQQCEFEFEV